MNVSPNRAVPRDLVVVASVTLAYFYVAGHVELSEKIGRWASSHEYWQVDELPLTLLLLAVALGWFSWRRLREARAEAAARTLAEAASAKLLQQNRLLAQQLIVLQEQERRNIAREIHDELGQCCNAIKLDATSIEKQLRGVLPGAHASARAIIGTASHIHEIVRSMLQRLRPAALDDLGLASCLQELVESWAQRQQIACAFVTEGDLANLGEALNITAYRLIQECLTNIARHALARHASVTIVREDAMMQITVDDDGRGMPATSPTGFGLIGMAERVHALGGQLVLSDRQPGVRVLVTLPLRATP